VPKAGTTEEQLSASFKKFTQKRRKQIYEKLCNNPVEEDRFNAFMEAFGNKFKSKIESVSQPSRNPEHT